MEGEALKRKVTILKKKPVVFTFSGMLKVKLLWKSSTDLDLCIFFKKKDGDVGGVFSSAFRQEISDLGSLSAFPFMLHTGDEDKPDIGNESVEQVKIANLNKIDTAYVTVLNYGRENRNENVNFAQDQGRIEILSDSGDYFEAVINSAQQGLVYNVCSIKNKDGVNSVISEDTAMDIEEAIEKIPGFSLICKYK